MRARSSVIINQNSSACFPILRRITAFIATKGFSSHFNNLIDKSFPSVCTCSSCSRAMFHHSYKMNLANVVFLVTLDRNVEGLSATPSPSHFSPAPVCVLPTGWSPSQRDPAWAPLQGPQLLPGIFSSMDQLPPGHGLCTGCSFLQAMATWSKMQNVGPEWCLPQHGPLHGCSETPASPQVCRGISASTPRAPPPPPPPPL